MGSGSYAMKREAIISKEGLARIVMTMESCDTTCPHCGRVNQISGFSQVFSFVCRYCREGVTV
jgi:hypothetical protein